MVENIIVDGASLPVPNLHEAGAFRGAAILHRLYGWRPVLGLERAHTHTHTYESFDHDYCN